MPTDALSSYSKTSKRRSIRDVCMRSIVSHDISKLDAQQQLQDDDSTVMSSSSLYSESTSRSLNSFMSLESGGHHEIRGLSGTSRNSEQTRPTKQRLKKVGFSTVEIRKYAVILGDNPETSYPLSLDWVHTKSRKFPINDFDVGRTVSPAPLGLNARMERLRKLGFTNAELRTMERDRKMNLLKEWQSTSDFDFNGNILAPPRAVSADLALIPSKC